MCALKFSEEVCATCPSPDCLLKCQYMAIGKDEAKEEMMKIGRGERSQVLKDCVTCYACEEYCPHGNHPFYRIVEAQERFGIHVVPKPIEESQVRMMAPKGKKKEQKELKGTVIDMCVFPMLKGCIRSPLFENTSVFSGNDVFCNLMYLHFSRSSTIKERLPAVMENIATYMKDSGTDEVVCFHDECYGTYTAWAGAYGIDPPFKPIHLFEYIHKRLLALQGQIKPLGVKVAYQRNCSARLVPETEHYVNDIFGLIGAERVKREYDFENALCCGAVLEAQQRFDLAESNQDRNVEDMKAAGATFCIFNCPMCFFTLMEKVVKAGMTPMMMSDFCQLALGR
jgi:Fe-S oxidoreductase